MKREIVYAGVDRPTISVRLAPRRLAVAIVRSEQVLSPLTHSLSFSASPPQKGPLCGQRGGDDRVGRHETAIH